MRKSALLIVAVSAWVGSDVAWAKTHNDCRIAYRDCMTKKDPLETCLKIKRDCEAEVRADLEKNKKTTPPGSEPAHAAPSPLPSVVGKH